MLTASLHLKILASTCIGLVLLVLSFILFMPLLLVMLQSGLMSLHVEVGHAELSRLSHSVCMVGQLALIV